MPIDQLTTITQAIEARAWYPAVAGLITLLLALVRRVAPETWERLPRRWQWVPAVALAAMAAFVDGATSGLPWTVSVSLAVYSLLAAAMPAIGLAHAGKRLTGADSATGATAAIVALLVTVPLLGAMACSSWGRDADCPDEQTLAALEAAYVAQVLAECPPDQYGAPEDCPRHLPIRAEYQTRRQAWVECR